MTTRPSLKAIGIMPTSALEDLLDAATLAGDSGLAADIQDELDGRTMEASLPAYEGYEN